MKRLKKDLSFIDMALSVIGHQSYGKGMGAAVCGDGAEMQGEQLYCAKQLQIILHDFVGSRAGMGEIGLSAVTALDPPVRRIAVEYNDVFEGASGRMILVEVAVAHHVERYDVLCITLLQRLVCITVLAVVPVV